MFEKCLASRCDEADFPLRVNPHQARRGALAKDVEKPVLLFPCWAGEVGMGVHWWSLLRAGDEGVGKGG